MALPEELGDGAAHRVAHRNDRAGVQVFDQGGDVVGAVLEAEGAPAPDPPAVAAMVERDQAVLRGQRTEAATPVEGRRRGPAMQQDEGGAVRLGLYRHAFGVAVIDPASTPAGQLDRVPGWKVRDGSVHGRQPRSTPPGNGPSPPPAQPLAQRPQLSGPLTPPATARACGARLPAGSHRTRPVSPPWAGRPYPASAAAALRWASAAQMAASRARAGW